MAFHLDIHEEDVGLLMKVEVCTRVTAIGLTRQEEGGVVGPIERASIIVYDAKEAIHLSRRQREQLSIRRPSSIVVNLQYVLDCMTQNKVLDTRPYLIPLPLAA